MKTENKKVRLIVTKKCTKHCAKCCNKSFDIDSISLIDRYDYDEVIFTGGEPLMDITKLTKLVNDFEDRTPEHTKFYVYTSELTPHNLVQVRMLFDGVTFTPHIPEDIQNLIAVTDIIRFEGISRDGMRLSLFPEMKELLPADFHYKDVWMVKDVVWMDECPVPDGEDLRRCYIF